MIDIRYMKEYIMTPKQIRDWMWYARRHNYVNVNEIKTKKDLETAKRFCPIFREFEYDNVTDDQLMEAIQEIRNFNNMFNE